MAYNANMNVADIRAGLLAGDFTAREVAEASFKRIEELDGEVQDRNSRKMLPSSRPRKSMRRSQTVPLTKWVRSLAYLWRSKTT